MLTIKLHQQYEAPAAVVATVQRLRQPDFDAMATPLSVVCGNYATLEDDVLKPEVNSCDVPEFALRAEE